MLGIKKLDIFVLKAFLPLFCGTFFMSLLIFMLQFMWRYVNDLVGKGLSIGVIGEFFYYAALTLVPMSLPLAVLLASLITFGNMAEKLELLSMKAAGVQLIRVLAPVGLLTVLLAVGSFYFQNEASPNATRQLATMTWGMKQKNPELDIPEGMFYNDIPGYNLYVERKNKETGHLYNVMIYSVARDGNDTQIVLSDSAHLQSTEDHRHLMLTMWNGRRFQNMKSQGGMGSRVGEPYMSETFVKEVDLIAFDNNFNALDANLFDGNAQVKNLSQLRVAVDSMRHEMDSVGRNVLYSMSRDLKRGPMYDADTAALVAVTERTAHFDTLRTAVAPSQSGSVLERAQRHTANMLSEYSYRKMTSDETAKQIRRHEMEQHKKFSMSLCCVIFFFIGAPLGAIIKKGGIGLPVVISVCIFIAYYIVNVAGEKLAKTGDWEVWKGIWLSTAVFAPVAIWLTYKANRDSTLFNSDAYRLLWEKIKHPTPALPTGGGDIKVWCLWMVSKLGVIKSDKKE